MSFARSVRELQVWPPLHQSAGCLRWLPVTAVKAPPEERQCPRAGFHQPQKPGPLKRHASATAVTVRERRNPPQMAGSWSPGDEAARTQPRTPGRDGPANKDRQEQARRKRKSWRQRHPPRLPTPTLHLKLTSATPPTGPQEPAGASTRQGAAAAGSHDAGAARGRGRARAEATRLFRTHSPLGAMGRNPAPRRCTAPRRPCCASSRHRPDSQGAGGQSRGPQPSPSPRAKRLKARDAAPSPAD